MIVSFIPFRAVEVSYDACKYYYTFKCPLCGSSSAIKLGDYEKNNFWSGFYMCYNCGMTQSGGQQFNYYHDCFIRHSFSQPVQLSLF